MSRRIAGQRLVVTMVVALGAAACGGSGPSPAATAGPPVAPSLVASAATSAAPVATPDPLPSSLAEPPAASLAVDGGDPVTGSLGSFTWGDGGSDSPWLPGAPVTVASGEPLTVDLAADVPVRDWTAKRVAAGSSDGTGAVEIGEGGPSPISFPAPGRGTWSVQVVVTFGDGLGSAAYYWQVTVT